MTFDGRSRQRISRGIRKIERLNINARPKQKLWPTPDGFAIKLGKTVSDIEPDQSGSVTVWDGSDGTPTETDEVIEDVQLDWMHGGEQVSQGKEVAIMLFGDTWRIMWAECE